MIAAFSLLGAWFAIFATAVLYRGFTGHLPPCAEAWVKISTWALLTLLPAALVHWGNL